MSFFCAFFTPFQVIKGIADAAYLVNETAKGSFGSVKYCSDIVDELVRRADEIAENLFFNP